MYELVIISLSYYVKEIIINISLGVFLWVGMAAVLGRTVALSIYKLLNEWQN